MQQCITKAQLETYQIIMAKIFEITAERPIEGFTTEYKKGTTPRMRITWASATYEGKN